MKALIAWAAFATIAAAVFAILYFSGNTAHINELEEIKAQYRADSTVTAGLIQSRDCLLRKVEANYSDLMKSVTSRPRNRNRADAIAHKAWGLPPDTIMSALDSLPPAP